jgi:hypothetical protein
MPRTVRASGIAALFFVVAGASWGASPVPTSDPLAAIDMNRNAIIADIVAGFRAEIGITNPQAVVQIEAQLKALRADRLMAASLASSYAGLQSVLRESQGVALKPTQQKALGDPSRDLVYTPLPPCRLIDTRGFGAPITGGAFAPNTRRSYVPNGLCGVPVSAVVSMIVSFTTENLTPGSGGYIAIVAPAAPVTTTVDIFNIGAEWSASNAAIPTGPAGEFDIFVSNANPHVVVDILGYFSAPSTPAGTVTSVTTGSGLTGGPITTTGTIGLATTQALPAVACATNQIPKWSGSAWVCAADAIGGGVASVTASAPLASTGGSTPDISLAGAIPVANGGTGRTSLVNNGIVYGQGTAGLSTAVGGVGQVLTATAGAPAWSDSLSLNGNLGLSTPSTASAGSILKAGNRFLHDHGTSNTFLGLLAGNFALTGTDNAGIGAGTLKALTSGGSNVAAGSNALPLLTTGSSNVAIGNATMTKATVECCNTVVGTAAYANGTGGSFNVMVGQAAGIGGISAILGDFNTIVGTNSFGSTTSASATQNTGVGGGVLGALTTGGGNIALGYSAGSNITTGSLNISIGNSGNAADSGVIRIGSFLQNATFIAGIRGVTPANADAVNVVIDSSGQLGTAAGGSGTVTSVATGAGLTGGPITTTGTIALAPAYQLPQSCINGQIAVSTGASSWTCGNDSNSGGTVTGVSASAPLASSGGTAPTISLSGSVPVANGGTGLGSVATNGVLYGQGTAAMGAAVGGVGQVLAATAGAPTWTSSPSLGGNLVLSDSTATAGNIFKGGNSFIHNFGGNNTFIGLSAGNFTSTGFANVGVGLNALSADTDGFNNTAVGTSALASNTAGIANAAIGAAALAQNTIGFLNTALGSRALENNASASRNTAIGSVALATQSFANGGLAWNSYNVAVGSYALANNAPTSTTNGIENTAVGAEALLTNSVGSQNTAAGRSAMAANTSGTFNVAVGMNAMLVNTVGSQNVAVGVSALNGNTSGVSNTAIGNDALINVTGNNNIGLGIFAGSNIGNGSGNIHIGSSGAAESNTIRIGAGQSAAFVAGVRGVTTGVNNAVAVMVDGNGQLGTISSSRRFKDDIADMAAASSALMKLRPVTFHYKTDKAPQGPALQYGLIAEEVAEVYPGLVAHGADGQVETVMYQYLPSMLLNEYQKQQRTIAAQATHIAKLQEDRALLAQAVAEIAELKQQTALLARLLDQHRLRDVSAAMDPR